MKTAKKILSMLLAVLMIVSIIPMSSITVSAAYENTYTNTGNQRVDIIGVAKTQIGYVEGSNDDTKYGDWYGLPNQAWCAMFVSWCANQAGIPTSVLKKTARAHPDNFGIPYYDGKSYTPKSGDLFFEKDFSHVGLVYYIEGDYFYTIEGNWSNKVCSVKKKISEHYFGVPNYSNSSSGSTTFSLSSGTVNLALGGIESQTINIIRSGNYNTAYMVSVANSNSSIAKVSLGSWSGSTRSLTITALSKGTTTLTIRIRNTDSTLLQTYYVTVNVSEKTYTILYNANGGTGAPASQTKTHGTALTLSTIKPTRTGYTFLGWSTSSTATSATYSAGSSFTTNANTTLYAVWKPNTYTVVYNGNGSTSGSTASSSHQYSGSLIISSGTYYKAYEFMQTGHDLAPVIDKHGTGKYLIEFDLYADVAGSMSVYMQNGSNSKYDWGVKTFDATTSWKHYSFIVDVNLKDSSEVQSMLAFYGIYGTGRNPHVKNILFTKADENLTANGFSRTGYTFLGWSTSSTATSATYTDKQAVKNLTSTNGGTVTLYAVWKANTYTVSYNANGGTGTMSNQTYTYGYVQSLSANRFTKQGYSFVGWSTNPNATSAEFSDMMLVQNLTSTNGGTVTLYAVWKANTYTVSYNANGGTGAPSSQTKTYGKTLTLSSTIPTREGYTFLGWSTSSTATSATYSAGSSFTTNANTTLYAVWKKAGYDINNDGIVNSNDTGLYKYDGTWYYVNSGNIDYTFTGLTKHTNGIWYYVEDGVLDWSYSGLWKHNGTWYYVQNGQINWKFTGLVKHTNGIWYYVQGAKLNWNKTGLVKHTNGIWYYVQKGQLNWNKTGLVKHTDGNWYYVQKGQINWNYTGLVKHTNGKYYFVQKGKLNWDYTGYAYYNGKKYKVVNGVKV